MKREGKEGVRRANGKWGKGGESQVLPTSELCCNTTQFASVGLTA